MKKLHPKNRKLSINISFILNLFILFLISLIVTFNAKSLIRKDKWTVNQNDIMTENIEINSASDEIGVLGITEENIDQITEQDLLQIVGKYPDYIAGYLKLADLYRMANNIEKSKQMLDKVSEIDPNNKTAKNILKSFL